MRKATKKPVEISFMTFDEVINEYKSWKNTPNHWKERAKEYGTTPNVYKFYHRLGIQDDNTMNVRTLESDNQKFTKEDVLIIGVRGEIYPCKIDIFKETYDYEGD